MCRQFIWMMWLLACVIPSPATAHEEATHRDATAYAFELMAVAHSDAVRARFFGDVEMTQFLAEMTAAVRTLEGLPADLPAPSRDRCIDEEVFKRFVTFSPITSAATTATVATFPVPVDLEYFSSDKNCGVDPYWQAGTLHRHVFPGAGTHAGNVFGFWSAYPDQQRNDVAMEARITNAAGVVQVKEIVEAAGGLAAGTVWVSVKCLTECAKGFFSLDFDACGRCISDAFEQGQQAVHDGVATIDGLVPGVPLGWIGPLQDAVSGICHHIDVKGDVVVPGWSTLNKGHYDDISGLYGQTPGPTGAPGHTEHAVLALTNSLGVSLDYDNSDGTRRYEILDGQDFHMNTIHRRRQDWEYLPWPRVPMPPLDNLAKFGWDSFRDSVARHRQDGSQPIQTRYLGWVLHGLGDATVPMHVTGTFAWGHRPYEDAGLRLGRRLLGEMSAEHEIAANEAEILMRAALVYRKQIKDWRTAHPEHGMDIPIRDLVTTLANRTLAAAQAHPGIYKDDLSTLWNIPGVARDAAIQAYTGEAEFMRERLRDTVAATIAFLTSAAEEMP